MKRYSLEDVYQSGQTYPIKTIKENENGSYVLYEDVTKIVRLLLDECGQDEIDAEDFIKEYG